MTKAFGHTRDQYLLKYDDGHGLAGARSSSY
jgi:hypothetical protein